MFLLLQTVANNTVNTASSVSLNNNWFENLYYLSQIIAVAILFRSALYAKEQYESQKRHSKIAQAAKLSKHFKESLIPALSKTQLLFAFKEIKNICSKIDLDNIKHFNLEELLKSIDPEELNMFKAALSLNLSDLDKAYKAEEDEEFRHIICECANDLEYF